MDLNGIPLFSLLQNKLGYLAERQKTIAQNVANASTPGFTPRDLKPFSAQPGINGKASAAAMTQTDASHLAGPPGAKGKAYAGFDAPDSEATLNGNQVVLEEQMLKMSEARTEYDAAIGFYQKALNMLHMAAKRPGA